MEVTQQSGEHTMEIMSSYVIDCHEKDRASCRAARKAFKGVQSSTASGDVTRILLRKSTARGGRNKLLGGRNALSLLSQAVRALLQHPHSLHQRRDSLERRYFLSGRLVNDRAAPQFPRQ